MKDTFIQYLKEEENKAFIQGCKLAFSGDKAYLKLNERYETIKRVRKKYESFLNERNPVK